MREIKFRAWDEDRGYMLHDFDQSLLEFYGLKVGDSIHEKVYRIGLSDETLMQYTGLKDKNGKEIYEGDIVESDCGRKVVKFVNEIISDDFRIGPGFFMEDCVFPLSNNMEVIGNIYENPELLT